MARTKDEYIDSLLGRQEDVAVSVNVPPALAALLIACGRRRFGNLEKDVILAKAIIYASALGTKEWREHYKPTSQRRIIKASFKGKTKAKAQAPATESVPA